MHKIVSMNTIFPTRIIRGDFNAHPIIDDYMSLKPKPEKDVLLIIGDGANVLQDIEAWYDIAEGYAPYDTFCVNYSFMVCPHKFQHFGAGDAHMPDMQRIAKALPKDVIKHAWNPGSYHFDVMWMRNGRGGWNGTSANLAFNIGLALDYTRIVLCGCPMDASGNWYSKLIAENDVKANKNHSHHLWKWTEIATRPISRFIRSMSGNTMDVLGKPTREWLLHEVENPEKEDVCQKMN